MVSLGRAVFWWETAHFFETPAKLARAANVGERRMHAIACYVWQFCAGFEGRNVHQTSQRGF